MADEPIRADQHTDHRKSRVQENYQMLLSWLGH